MRSPVCHARSLVSDLTLARTCARMRLCTCNPRGLSRTSGGSVHLLASTCGKTGRKVTSLRPGKTTEIMFFSLLVWSPCEFLDFRNHVFPCEIEKNSLHTVPASLEDFLTTIQAQLQNRCKCLVCVTFFGPRPTILSIGSFMDVSTGMEAGIL